MQNKFSVKVGILAQGGGGGLTQSQLFFKIDQNLICLGTAHKCWDFVAIWRGFPSPNQKITKNAIKNYQKSQKNQQSPKKLGLFHEQIICLE